MNNKPLKIAVIGGGTAGWMAAAYLSKAFPKKSVELTVVEPEEIPPIGVGEATIPPIRAFNNFLGINEAEFLSATGATFKLGINFQDWRQPGESYFHGFGDFGAPINGISPHEMYVRAQSAEYELQSLSFPAVAALKNRFSAPPTNPRLAEVASYSYAYHFDALRYAAFLKKYCLDRGVELLQKQVSTCELDEVSGDIHKICFFDGSSCFADFYIDCTGLRRLLIGKSLAVGYEDWSEMLLCDRAVAVQSAVGSVGRPYTISKAVSSGWTWEIPLQNRSGNGYVYSSKYQDNQSAAQELLCGLSAEQVSEPKFLQFSVGRSEKFWVRNCLALGLAAGFLEPLESTSIHLIQSGISRFVDFFNGKSSAECEAGRDEYNRITQLEYQRIRDFLVLHYLKSGRRDTDFWLSATSVTCADELKHKISVFTECAKVVLYDQESFLEPSWLAVLFGLGVVPKSTAACSALVTSTEAKQLLSKRMREIKNITDLMPESADYLNQVLAAVPR